MNSRCGQCLPHKTANRYWLQCSVWVQDAPWEVTRTWDIRSCILCQAPKNNKQKKAVTIIKNWESEKLGVGSDCILQHFCFHWVIPVTVLKELARVWPLLCKVLGFPDGSVVKNPPAIQETCIPSLGREDPLEEEMATHSSMLAWKIQGWRSLEGHSPRTWLSD